MWHFGESRFLTRWAEAWFVFALEPCLQRLFLQDKKEKTALLNEIGSCYFQADEKDQAIYYYEQSLEEDRQLGKAYTDLLKLYNQKRQEAAEAKDDEKLKEYMDKVQGLMQMSKDVLRGKM